MHYADELVDQYDLIQNKHSSLFKTLAVSLMAFIGAEQSITDKGKFVQQSVSLGVHHLVFHIHLDMGSENQKILLKHFNVSLHLLTGQRPFQRSDAQPFHGRSSRAWLESLS